MNKLEQYMEIYGATDGYLRWDIDQKTAASQYYKDIFTFWQRKGLTLEQAQAIVGEQMKLNPRLFHPLYVNHMNVWYGKEVICCQECATKKLGEKFL